ncbi:MAG TPA: flagellar hook protein FlgE [Gammaproteobacteria bacterium]|nr:flagellar hook protein FlgE [Gammaproteobacteria bacterium]
MAFRIALSGLNAASQDLDVTGNNIANASTTGFKQSRTEFADVFATSGGAVSSDAIGGGVRMSKVAQQFSQGNVKFTNNNMDLAINGEGFFILKHGGSEIYSRAGAFSVDRNGYVVNANAQRLQVYSPANAAGTKFNTGSLQDLQVSTSQGAPSATTSVSSLLNLDSSDSTIPTAAFSTTDPTTYNYSTSFTMYDSFGTSHTATMYFRKTSPKHWDAYAYGQTSSGTQKINLGGTNGAAQLVFKSDGSLDTTASSPLNGKPTGTFTPSNGANSMPLTFDFSKLTQYGSGYSVNAINQDGYSTGRLTGIDISDTGVVSARFTNGQSRSLGKVALANFPNKQGLRQLGDTTWAASYDSGDAIKGEASTGSFGAIQSGALESSNVDIAAQLVNLITAQRNFQANSQVITTADHVTQTIINMR